MKPDKETSTKKKELTDGEKSVPGHMFQPLDLAIPVAKSPWNLSL